MDLNTEEESAVAAAKTLVDRIRVIQTIADSGGVEQTAADTYFAAAELISDDSSLVLEAASEAIDAMVSAIFAFGEDDTIDSFTSDDGDGIAVTFNGNNQYTVAADIEVFGEVFNPESGQLDIVLLGTVAVDISMTGTATESETINETLDDGLDSIITYMEVFDEDVALAITSLSGTASNSEVSITINSATSGSLALSESGVFNDSFDAENFDNNHTTSETVSIEVSLAEFTLDVTLEQVTGDTPVSFTGELSFSIEDLQVDEAFTEGFVASEDCQSADNLEEFSAVHGLGWTVCVGGFEETIVTKFSAMSLGFNGTFSQGTASFSAVLAANLTVPEGISINEYDAFGNWVLLNESFEFQSSSFIEESTSEIIGETENLFVSGSLSLSVEFDLANVDPNASFIMTANRTGLNDATANLDIIFGGNVLDVDLVLADDVPTLTISDQDGTIATLTETEDSTTGELIASGSIVVDSETAATIDEEVGALIIRYNDGTVSSL